MTLESEQKYELGRNRCRVYGFYKRNKKRSLYNMYYRFEVSNS